MKIETKRLYVYPLQAAEMTALANDLPSLEHLLHVSYQAEPIEGELRQIIKQQNVTTKQDAIHYYWHTFWLLIRKSDRVVVGSADFKDGPDEHGNVEIGYGLGEAFEGQGYMTEAVKGMCAWALSRQGVSHVTAQTELNGFRSQAVLKRCGFKAWFIGETAWWIKA